MAVTYLVLIPLFPELLSSQTHLAAVSGVSVSTKRSGCPAQSQTCPGSVFRSWVWMEYPSLLPTENLWVPFLVLIPKCKKGGRIFFHIWEVYYHPRHHYSASSSSFSSLGTDPGNTWYTDGQGALTLGYQSPTDTNTTSMSWKFTHSQCYLCEASLQVWSFLLRNVPRTSW